MREIKFRAWDKDEQIMHSDVGSGIYCDPDEILGFDRILGLACYEVMQFTGLKDKNGMEIFEGDIVEYKGLPRWQTTRSELLVVEWSVVMALTCLEELERTSQLDMVKSSATFTKILNYWRLQHEQQNDYLQLSEVWREGSRLHSQRNARLEVDALLSRVRNEVQGESY